MTTITKKSAVEKITNRQLINTLVDELNQRDPEEVLATVSVSKEETAPLTVATAIDKLNHILEGYNRKSNAPKKPSSASIQNTEYAQILVEFLEKNKGVGFTCAELAKAEGLPEVFTGSKITAIAKHFPDTVCVDKVKGKNIYYIPAEEIVED